MEVPEEWTTKESRTVTEREETREAEHGYTVLTRASNTRGALFLRSLERTPLAVRRSKVTGKGGRRSVGRGMERLARDMGTVEGGRHLIKWLTADDKLISGDGQGGWRDRPRANNS